MPQKPSVRITSYQAYLYVSLKLHWLWNVTLKANEEIKLLNLSSTVILLVTKIIKKLNLSCIIIFIKVREVTKTIIMQFFQNPKKLKIKNYQKSTVNLVKHRKIPFQEDFATVYVSHSWRKPFSYISEKMLSVLFHRLHA
jgi:hypothetical protein